MNLLSSAADVVGKDEFFEKIKKKGKLKIKLGCDPSSPDLHLGHYIPLKNLRKFQDAGHEVIFIVGDFTASIGDPTGKNEMRKPLSKEEIAQNAQTYQTQVFKVLDINKTKVVYNGEWLNKLTPIEFIKLTSHYTVARMLERDDFEKRYKSGVAIGIHEFMYPLMQGYDSVVLKNDVEIGGTDQRFNLLVGRDLQRDFGIEPQVCVMFPLLEGLDGVNKMSKSLNNTINFKDEPTDMFGKVMSVSDELMWKYYKVVLDKSESEISELKKGHPKEAKLNLGKQIVSIFYDQDTGEKAKQAFEAVFAKGNLPDDMPEIDLTKAELEQKDLFTLLTENKICESKSDAKRLLQSNAISSDGEKLSTSSLASFTSKKEFVLKVGKRKYLKVKVSN